jgi:catechol 2,3-dioxygenase-like lactoylglutathione lyase family enzyme
LIKRLARYLNDPNRAAAPIFADAPPPRAAPLRVRQVTDRVRPAAPPSEPHIRGLDHVALATTDLARALDFYRGLLGFRMVGEVDTGQGLVVTLLDTGRGLIGLYVCTGDAAGDWLPRPGAGQVALSVTGLEAIADQLICADVPCLLEPTTLAGRATAAFHDPDGNVIRLVEGEITYTRR